MADEAVHPLNGLLMLLELQRQARRTASAPELRYHIVNQTRRLIAHRQAAFLTLPPTLPGCGRPTLEAVSNIAVLEPNAPFVRWLEDAVRAVAVRELGGVEAMAKRCIGSAGAADQTWRDRTTVATVTAAGRC